MLCQCIYKRCKIINIFIWLAANMLFLILLTSLLLFY
uniref:Uncharacterized protein n=1 Tax=Arundo donax TaxID=35708 RepID=A0A0A9H9Y8_ARUDO